MTDVPRKPGTRGNPDIHARRRSRYGGEASLRVSPGRRPPSGGPRQRGGEVGTRRRNIRVAVLAGLRAAVQRDRGRALLRGERPARNPGIVAGER
jgi:hypothetical protein